MTSAQLINPASSYDRKIEISTRNTEAIAEVFKGNDVGLKGQIIRDAIRQGQEPLLNRIIREVIETPTFRPVNDEGATRWEGMQTPSGGFSTVAKRRSI